MGKQRIMSTTDDLRLKFPLGRRKFIRQMFGRVLLLLFLGLIGVVTILLNADTYVDHLAAVLIGWAGVLGVLFLLYSAYTRAYIRAYSYVLEDGALVIRGGVFFSLETRVLPEELSQITINQGLLNRLLGLCDIYFGDLNARFKLPKHIDGLDSETAESLVAFLTRAVKTHSADSVYGVESASEQLQSTDTVAISERSHPISGLWLFEQAVQLGMALGLAWIVWWAQYQQGVVADVLSLGERFAILVMVYLVALLQRYWWRKTYRYSVTQDGVVVSRGSVFKREKQLYFSGIGQVSIDRGWFGRLLGIAQVNLYATGGESGFQRGARRPTLGIPGQSIQGAEQIKTYIESRLTSLQTANARIV